MDKKTEAITLQIQSGVEAIASEPLFPDYAILAEAVLLDYAILVLELQAVH